MDGVGIHHAREWVAERSDWTALTLFTDTKFILLHETKNEEGIRGFLQEVWELYLKVCRPRSPCVCD
jgi:hypothetical protein